MNHTARMIGTVALGAALFTVAPAIAQTTGDQQGEMPSATQPAPDFSQEELKSFAAAQSAVRAIGQSARKALRNAPDRQERKQVRKRARQKMVAAIKDAGLTVRQYNRIARAARSNRQLARKIQQFQ